MIDIVQFLSKNMHKWIQKIKSCSNLDMVDVSRDTEGPGSYGCSDKSESASSDLCKDLAFLQHMFPDLCFLQSDSIRINRNQGYCGEDTFKIVSLKINESDLWLASLKVLVNVTDHLDVAAKIIIKETPRFWDCLIDLIQCCHEYRWKDCIGNSSSLSPSESPCDVSLCCVCIVFILILCVFLALLF